MRSVFNVNLGHFIEMGTTPWNVMHESCILLMITLGLVCKSSSFKKQCLRLVCGHTIKLSEAKVAAYVNKNCLL